MNQLDPIEELYNMYSEEEDTLRIVEVEDDGLGLDSDIVSRPIDIAWHCVTTLTRGDPSLAAYLSKSPSLPLVLYSTTRHPSIVD